MREQFGDLGAAQRLGLEPMSGEIFSTIHHNTTLKESFKSFIA
jgi:hypothetical protein